MQGKENMVQLRCVKTLCPLDDEDADEGPAAATDMKSRYDAEVKRTKRRRFKFGFLSTDNKTLVRGG